MPDGWVSTRPIHRATYLTREQTVQLFEPGRACADD